MEDRINGVLSAYMILEYKKKHQQETEDHISLQTAHISSIHFSIVRPRMIPQYIINLLQM